MSDLKIKNIDIDLNKSTITVIFTNRYFSPLSIIFKDDSPKFYLAIIAWMIIQQKFEKSDFIDIQKAKYKDELELLDNKIAIGYASKSYQNLKTKIKRTWLNELPNLVKPTKFKITNRRKIEDHEDNILQYDVEREQDEWGKLFINHSRLKSWHLKFAFDKVRITLDDVNVIYNDHKNIKAWENFKNDLTTMRSIINYYDDEDQPKIDHHQENEKDQILLFLKSIFENFNTLSVFHLSREINWDDLYIPIQVTPERLFRHEVESIGSYTETEQYLNSAYAIRHMESESYNPISWKKAREDFKDKNIMVLADPGMGKTTLLQFEVAMVAKSQIERIENDDRPITEYHDEVIFPIFIRLDDLADFEEESLQAILSIIEREYTKTFTPIQHIVKKKLETGRCRLYLDALDEVPHSLRNNLSRKLDRFIRNFHCQIICSSRIVGYHSKFIYKAKEIELLPYSKNQIEKYINCWFKYVLTDPKNNGFTVDRLILELKNKPQISELLQNPLLLSLVCSLFAIGKIKLPTKKVEIYKEALIFLLKDWSYNKRPKSMTIQNLHMMIVPKIALLEELAYHFSTYEKQIIRNFNEKEIIFWIDKYLKRNDILSDLKKFSPIELLIELSENDGILQKLDRNGNQYIFLHRTFQEFLTASYLKRIFRENVAQVLDEIKKYYWDLDWHETIIFLSGILPQPKILIDDIFNSPDDIFGSLLMLTGQCVIESNCNLNATIEEIIKKIFVLWLHYPNAQNVVSLIENLGKKYEIVIEKLNQYIDRKQQNIDQVKANLPDFIKTKELKYSAAKILARIGRPEGIQTLSNALEDYNYLDRTKAINYLGNIGYTECIAPLTKIITDSDENIRTYTARALGQIGEIECIEYLSILLNDNSMLVQRESAEALAKMGTFESISILTEALSEENIYKQVNAAIALVQIGRFEGVPILIDAVKSKDKNLRCNAVYTLKDVRISGIIPLLANALEDSDVRVKIAASQALSRFGHPDVIQVLVDALKNDNIYVSYLAAIALVAYDRPEGIPYLINALKDDDEYIRFLAAKALGKSGRSEGVSYLIEQCNSSNSFRSLAASTLGKIGSHVCVQALIEGLNYWDTERAAAEGLKNIRTLEVLKQIITDSGINIYQYDVFMLTRTIILQNWNKEIEFYPLTIDKIRYYKPLLTHRFYWGKHLDPNY
ncbi:PBS lyase HEAT-like repeat domain protein [Desulfosarcina variabilis str. Montpellier]|uniref:HEAT repeat domain-containing protein n=1 Tax=Desulfosarcina variabilis TaxID=2300 RepID=UPI003AFA2BD9